MSVPARHSSKTRTRNRRSHHNLKPINGSTCSNCKAPVMSHTACKECGFYKGHQAISVARKKSREMKRLQSRVSEKAARAKEEKEEDSKEKKEETKKPE